jgi:hypothetical protein
VDADVSEFIGLIREARENTSDIRATVIAYSWANYGAKIASEMTNTDRR